jgi:hypothetical protein
MDEAYRQQKRMILDAAAMELIERRRSGSFPTAEIDALPDTDRAELWSLVLDAATLGRGRSCAQSSRPTSLTGPMHLKPSTMPAGTTKPPRPSAKSWRPGRRDRTLGIES